MAGAWDWQPPYISDHKYNTLKTGGGALEAYGKTQTSLVETGTNACRHK